MFSEKIFLDKIIDTGHKWTEEHSAGSFGQLALLAKHKKYIMRGTMKRGWRQIS
jgi:hypothetical protein